MTRFEAPIAEQIWDMKYRLKDSRGLPVDMDVEDTWQRIADALAEAEGNYVSKVAGKKVKGETARIRKHAEAFLEALTDWKFTPAGRIVAGAGTNRRVTLFNCYVMGTIPDSMAGIFDMLKEAALTMQQGGGIGYDFSTIRPKSSWVKGVDSDASGPLSFMDCWDAMCRTVMSAGSRRGAMMATMRCDHPDILDYVNAKRDAARLRMFNMSVLVTDAFMAAVDENQDWPLVHVEPPTADLDAPILDHAGDDTRGNTGLPRYIHKTIKARDLWNEIMQSTYDVAEPGVIFIDRINELNNLKLYETISSTNPCGEQPLPPYGACLLGSINLAKMVRFPFLDESSWNLGLLKRTVATAIRMMDNVIDVSNFPLPAQEVEAKNKRRIGLGVTGLADALIMLGVRYGSEEAEEVVSFIMREIALASYWASVDLAKEKGPFPLYNAELYPAPGSHVAKLCEEEPELSQAIADHGIRNALVTSIAPTGTISLYAGNVSSGIEPVFALSYTRKVLQKDGTRTEEVVEDYAVTEYRKFYETIIRQPGDMPFDPDRDLPSYFVTTADLTPAEHVRMQAAAQEWVDSSISKTVNLPEDISFSEFKRVYWDAFESGCKGCTTYRPNEVTGSVLSSNDKPKEEPDEIEGELDDNLEELLAAARGHVMTEEESTAQAKSLARGFSPMREDLPARPEELKGSTYKIKIGDQSAVYLTVNDMTESDGTVRPFEVFLRSSDPSHDEWMVALARTISAVLRRPYDARFLVDELKQVHSHVTGGFGMGAYTPSLVAAIGKKLGDHMDALKGHTLSEMLERAMTGKPDWADDVDPGIFGPDSWVWRPINPNKVTGVASPEDATQAVQTPVAPPSCPKCHGYDLKHDGGCPTCLSCGWSKCG